jgi:hypothetical protein
MEILFFIILAPLLLPIFFIMRLVVDPILNFTMGSSKSIDSSIGGTRFRSTRTNATSINSWSDSFIQKVRNFRLPIGDGPGSTGQVAGADRAANQRISQLQSEVSRLELANRNLEHELTVERGRSQSSGGFSAPSDEGAQAGGGLATDDGSQAREIASLKGELATERERYQTLASSGGAGISKAAILETDVAEKREDIINQLNTQMNPGAAAQGGKVRSEAGIILRQVDGQLRQELDKIGKVFVGLSSRQLSFSEEELKTFLTSTYFRVMGSAVVKKN